MGGVALQPTPDTLGVQDVLSGKVTSESGGVCGTLCPLCGMGIPHRFRRTRIDVFLMLAAVCERRKPDASLGGTLKIPDASFWMDM